MDDLFSDDVISNCLTIRQSKAGYRFGIDALLLATDLPDFEPIGRRVVELGAAHGPVCLSIANRLDSVEVIAVEVQQSLFDLLRYNASLIAADIQCVLSDVRDIRDALPAHHVALVVFNPPYFPLARRRPSTQEERAIARHEVKGSLIDFLRAAQFVLHPRGWCKFVIPPWRLGDVWAALPSLDFGCVSMRFIHATSAQNAYLVEVILRRGANTDMVVRPMLCIRDEGGYYTPEVCRRVAGAACATPSQSWIEQVRLRSFAR